MKVVKVPMPCPRCRLSMIPNNEFAGQYPGALSRADNQTEICSDCGTDEAITMWMEGYIAPVDTWPVMISATTAALKVDIEKIGDRNG